MSSNKYENLARDAVPENSHPISENPDAVDLKEQRNIYDLNKEAKLNVGENSNRETIKNSRRVETPESERPQKSQKEQSEKINLENSFNGASSNAPPKHKTKKASSKPRTKGSQNLVQYNLSNVSNVHIGSNYTVNINKNQENQPVPKKDFSKTEAVEKLMLNANPITKEIMIFASIHTGEGWRNVARTLDYSDGQIEQLHENFFHISIKEVIYQLFLDWKQNKPEEATIGLLASTLWGCEEQDVVIRMSKQF